MTVSSLVAVTFTMLSLVLPGRAFISVSSARISRRFPTVVVGPRSVRGVVAVDRPSVRTAVCLSEAQQGDAGPGRCSGGAFGAMEGPAGGRGLFTSATRLSAVGVVSSSGAVNPVSRTSSTTLEQVGISVFRYVRKYKDRFVFYCDTQTVLTFSDLLAYIAARRRYHTRSSFSAFRVLLGRQDRPTSLGYACVC